MTKFVTMVAMATMVASVMGGEPVGWRGDGSGIYPKADPPIQWLVLGPVAAQKGPKNALTDPVWVEDQSKLSPAAGQQAGGAEWKALKTDTAYLDFARQFDTYGKGVEQAVYAHAYVYSPVEASFVIRVMHTSALTLWVNGKCTHKFTETEQNYTPQGVKLLKGWNRLLVRSTPTGTGEGRPIKGTWYFNLVVQAAPDKAQYDQKGIAWRTAMPAGDGFGGPIAIGGKAYLLSEPADLVCIDGAGGKILWVRSNNYNELATDDERKAQPEVFKEIDPLAARLREVNDSFTTPTPPQYEQAEGRQEYKEKASLERKLYALMKKVDDKKYAMPKGQDVGYAGVTPVSDGKYIYAWFATGVTCCYDLDGKLVWRRLDNEGSFFEHGYSSSPVLADGKLIVFMNKMIALDAAKGDRLWATEFDPKDFWANRFHGTPAAAKVGQTSVCVLPTGQILRLSDGKIVRAKGPEVTGAQQEIPSPVVAGNTVYRLSTYNRFLKYALPAEFADPLKIDNVRDLKMDLTHYPTNYLEWHMASPLVHEGLAYLLNNTGVLTVVDLEKMETVYEKLLDLDHFQTAHEGAGRGVAVCPALAGGRIYLVGTDGTTIVLKPGRTFEPLARNRIESVFYRYYGLRHERFVANPAFDGKRMFLRGERFLYCLAGQ